MSLGLDFEANFFWTPHFWDPPKVVLIFISRLNLKLFEKRRCLEILKGLQHVRHTLWQTLKYILQHVLSQYYWPCRYDKTWHTPRTRSTITSNLFELKGLVTAYSLHQQCAFQWVWSFHQHNSILGHPQEWFSENSSLCPGLSAIIEQSSAVRLCSAVERT